MTQPLRLSLWSCFSKESCDGYFSLRNAMYFCNPRNAHCYWKEANYLSMWFPYITPHVKAGKRVSRSAPHLHNPRLSSLASRCSLRKRASCFTFGGTVITIA